MAAAGASGQQDKDLIDGIANIGDIQTVLHRMIRRMDVIEHEINVNASGAEQQLATMRIDIRGVRAQAASAPQNSKKFDLIDMKAMSPSKFGGAREESFKAWEKDEGIYKH